jgi:hypothetical protein
MVRRRHYRPSGRPRSSLDEQFRRYLRGLRGKRDKDSDDGGVPVEPNKPSTLSGGAAAELEFDD